MSDRLSELQRSLIKAYLDNDPAYQAAMERRRHISISREPSSADLDHIAPVIVYLDCTTPTCRGNIRRNKSPNAPIRDVIRADGTLTCDECGATLRLLREDLQRLAALYRAIRLHDVATYFHIIAEIQQRAFGIT